MAILEKNKFMLLKDKLCQERRLECFMIFTMMCFVYLQYADNFKINPYKEHFYENHIFQGTVVKGPNQNKPYQVIAVCGDELSATGGRVYLTKKVGRTSDIKEANAIIPEGKILVSYFSPYRISEAPFYVVAQRDSNLLENGPLEKVEEKANAA